jgi:PAS domain S-box-containing protein
MTPLVPKKTTVVKKGRLFQELSDLLFSALEFIGAEAGWMALRDASGGLSFPVRGGDFADGWLNLQQEYHSVWGFRAGDGPALLNDLRPWSKLVDPSLHNLLSCPLNHNDRLSGQVVLANKAHGFAATDAVVLQGLAHHMARLLDRRAQAAAAPVELSAGWRRMLDRSSEGIVVLDESGTLIYANATWLDWTGCRAEELLGRKAPFPFWICQQDLERPSSMAAAASANVLPFRRRDRSLFWCRLDTAVESWNDQMLTIAFLQCTSVSMPPSSESVTADALAVKQPHSLRPAAADWLALVLDLDDGIEGWSAAWEERTGLSVRDVEDSRSQFVLDWLFPQQHDRDRVADWFHHPHSSACQLVLEVAAVRRSRPMLCTFLPLPARTATSAPRRWLLLVGDAEPSTIDGTQFLDTAAGAEPEA